jgi:hypothetical protein
MSEATYPPSSLSLITAFSEKRLRFGRSSRILSTSARVMVGIAVATYDDSS